MGEGAGAVARVASSTARRVATATAPLRSAWSPGVLYGEAAAGDKSASKATGKLEEWLGGGELRADEALAWADAAEQALRRRLEHAPMKEVQPLLQQADAVAGRAGRADAAHRSRFLRAGYEQRLAAFADALQGFAKGKAKELPATVEAAAEAMLDHALAGAEPERADRVEMALRLARWLAARRVQGETAAGSLAEAARGYRQDGGYVDWARSRLWDGDPLAALGHAYTLLWQAIGRVREDDNRRFGELLANWAVTGSHDTSVIPVEKVLERVVAPLAKAHPVLLVVVDGMGMAVFRELQPDLVRRGWVEIDASGRVAPACR